MSAYKIAAFYHFADFPDYADWRERLREHGDRLGIKGIILLASEGVNGTVSGRPDELNELLGLIQADQRFNGMSIKFSFHETQPFYRLKVRLKKEIVSMGIPGVAPHRETGTRLDPAEWNALITQPDVLLIDTRNSYECELGKFRGALEPETESFREFPNYVDQTLEAHKGKKIAMYCTGGIRCEKASAYLLQKGFKEVYQLDGGILKYMEETRPGESLWEGECFVFDQRVSLQSTLEPGGHVLCHSCRHPLSEEDRAHPDYEENISCPHCRSNQTERDRAVARERELQIQLAKSRGEKHLGVRPEELQQRRLAKRAHQALQREHSKNRGKTPS